MAVDERVVAALRESATKDKVEDTFKTFNVSGMEDKINYLDAAMYNPQVFYSSGEETAIEHKYELALQMFLEGSWVLYEYYEKMGLGQCSKSMMKK